MQKKRVLEPVIVVHGGAGNWAASGKKISDAIAACELAVRSGRQIMDVGGTSMDAVESADSPLLDAGRGRYVNTAGEIEMDALIMDGENMDMGAVAAVRLIKNPISLARKVMTNCKHNFLVGTGAEIFADSIGFPRCSFSELLVSEQEESSVGALETKNKIPFGTTPQKDLPGDTVGAVALDSFGNLAVATSTGGTKDKLPGRVGDSPLVGSGAYADNWTAAVSATGYGEALMKVLISKRVCDFVADGLSTQKACEAAINVLHERVDGNGGLISVDVRGRVGVAFNTDAMPYAYSIGKEPIKSGS